MAWWWMLLTLVAIIFVLQLVVGSYPVSFGDLLHFSDLEDTGVRNILLQSRLPAAIAATVGGAALSVGGLQMQTYFRNPVAGPFVLGISSGASLGVAIFIMLAGTMGTMADSEWGVIVSSSVGAIVIFLVVMLMASRLNSPVSMLIIGLMMASFINAIIEAIQTIATADSIKSYLFWTMGSFRTMTLTQIPVMLLATGGALLISITLVKPLNLLLTGEEYARLTGLNVSRSRFWIVISTCLLTGGVTAFCGPIGFIGLAVPHLARGIFRTSDHKVLLPGVVLLGAAISGICNLLTAIPIHGLVFPINTITSLIGAPFVIWIVFRGRALR